METLGIWNELKSLESLTGQHWTKTVFKQSYLDIQKKKWLLGFLLLSDELVQKGLVAAPDSSPTPLTESDSEEEYTSDLEKYDKEGTSNHAKYKCNTFNEFHLIIRPCNYTRLIWFKNTFSEWENFEKEKSAGNETSSLSTRTGRKRNKWS